MTTTTKAAKKQAEVLRRAAEDLIALRAAKERAEEAFRAAQAEVIAYLDAQGLDTVTTESGVCTVVRSTTLECDESTLREILGEETWERVTRQVLDRRALDAMVTLGVVSPTLIAPAFTEKPRAPYVKVTGSTKEVK